LLNFTTHFDPSVFGRCRDNAALYSRSPSTLLNDVSVGRYNAAGGTSYVLLGPGDVVGEVAFFTEVPQLEVSQCRQGVVRGQ
jgi:hypothetical protein